MRIWKGISLDHWAQIQTLKPRPATKRLGYAGYEMLEYSPHWWDFIPAIPLDQRFASFSERLDKALAR